MDDLISRQAAIDLTWEDPSYSDPLNVLTEVRDGIKALPSAQPDVPGTNVGDTISRQAAIEALKGMAVPLYKDPACEDIWERDRTLDNAIDAIRGLPSSGNRK